ncbi:MAG: hypothetical protein ACK4Z5_07815 [Brevundimonas sp.]
MLPHALVALAILQSPAQFDLVCSGSVTEGGSRGQAYIERFRVDLDANRWCRGACERAFDIHEVTADRIVFAEIEPEARGTRVRSWLQVDRTSGDLDDYYSSVGRTVSRERRRAVCEPAPFSGLPTARF